MADLDFSFGRDFKRINWGQTAHLNLLRAVGAGIVFGAANLLFPSPQNVGSISSPLLSLAFPIVFPLIYFLLFFPFGCFLRLLGAMGVPFAGLAANIVGIIVAVGDPLVFILSKVRPTWVPVNKFSFFNFAMIVFAVKPIVEAVGEPVVQ